MTAQEALAHIQGSFNAYKMRCNSEMTDKDQEAFDAMWCLIVENEENVRRINRMAGSIHELVAKYCGGDEDDGK